MLVASVLLVLPDSRYVLHRRDKKAAASPGLLGFFGGEIEKNEMPEQAALRELSEETSISINEIRLNFLAKYQIPEPEKSTPGVKTFHLFRTEIKDTDFEVLEGVGKEIYHLRDLIKRTDLTPSVRYAVAEGII